MTIEYDRGKMVLKCDHCGEHLLNSREAVAHYDREDFDVLRDDMRDADWLANKDTTGVWVHTCPDCQ